MTLAIDQLQRQLWQAMTGDDGSLRNPPRALERAFFATPRHRFVQRFRTYENPLWRTPAEDLAGVYVDDALFLVADERGVHSTASSPGFILSLVQTLDIQPGHRVLEIGSGCGWLVAVMAHLAGPDGRVYGIEILPELVRGSRTNLIEIRNTTIHCGDGREGFAPGAPYDRVIATAAMPTIPITLLQQTKPGARLLLPIAHGEAPRCAVALYERTDEGLATIEAREGYFVPMVP